MGWSNEVEGLIGHKDKTHYKQLVIKKYLNILIKSTL